MLTDFRAIVQSKYGAPEKVLSIAKRQFKSEELGTDDVLLCVISRSVHPVGTTGPPRGTAERICTSPARDGMTSAVTGSSSALTFGDSAATLR